MDDYIELDHIDISSLHSLRSKRSHRSSKRSNTYINSEINSGGGEIDKIEKDDYVWEQLPKPWTDKLLSNNFVIKNCLGDGNCQFRSIETALINAGYKTNHERLRNVIAKYIRGLDNSEFFAIIQNYRIEKKNGEFVGDWDPFKIKNKRQFIIEIKKTGFNFQGDNITLSLLSKAIGIDIIILTSNFEITNLSNPDNLQPKIMILYYDKLGDSYGHYQTIGLKIKKKVQTIFKRPVIPKELDILLDKHTFILNHVVDICTLCDELKLNDILMSLQKRIGKISKNDKLTTMNIVKSILENQKYFKEINKSASPKHKRSKSRSRSPKRKSKSRSR